MEIKNGTEICIDERWDILDYPLRPHSLLIINIRNHLMYDYFELLENPLCLGYKNATKFCFGLPRPIQFNYLIRGNRNLHATPRSAVPTLPISP